MYQLTFGKAWVGMLVDTALRSAHNPAPFKGHLQYIPSTRQKRRAQRTRAIRKAHPYGEGVRFCLNNWAFRVKQAEANHEAC